MEASCYQILVIGGCALGVLVLGVLIVIEMVVWFGGGDRKPDQRKG